MEFSTNLPYISETSSPCLHGKHTVTSTLQRLKPSDIQVVAQLSLPLELHEYILEFLENERESLKTCALVCRVWLAYSRKLLYRDITIRTEVQYDALTEAIKSSPYIQECIHILRIDRRDQRYKLVYPWINSKIRRLLPQNLKRLHTLEFIEV